MNKLKNLVAYAGIYVISAGDSVRYLAGWPAWIVLSLLISGSSIYWFIKGDPKPTIKRIPLLMKVLFGWIALSLTWSFYPGATLLGFVALGMGTVFALFLISTYSWRELLRFFANTFRAILVASIAFELFAALVVKGAIDPVFKDFQGSYQTAGAYRWTQGSLLKGQRIQGIVGNANLLAYVAMLAAILFLVQYAISMTSRLVSIGSILLAVANLVLTRSAGVGLAMVMVVLAGVVLVLAEGKSKEQRHKFYRITWTLAGIGLFFVTIYSAQVFTFIGKSPDMTGRADLWAAVLSLVWQKPYFGWGWISYWMPGVQPYDGLFVRGGITYYQAHNIFLDFWVQIGLVGLLLLVGIMVITFVKLWRLAVSRTHPLYIWPLFVFVALVMHNFLESRLIVELGWVLFMITVVKVNEPAEALEAEPTITKKAALKLFGQRLLGRGWGRRTL
jgi:O-antigen ligase